MPSHSPSKSTFVCSLPSPKAEIESRPTRKSCTTLCDLSRHVAWTEACGHLPRASLMFASATSSRKLKNEEGCLGFEFPKMRSKGEALKSPGGRTALLKESKKATARPRKRARQIHRLRHLVLPCPSPLVLPCSHPSRPFHSAVLSALGSLRQVVEEGSWASCCRHPWGLAGTPCLPKASSCAHGFLQQWFCSSPISSAFSFHLSHLPCATQHGVPTIAPLHGSNLIVDCQRNSWSRYLSFIAFWFRVLAALVRVI